jgi:hypothetical protein
MMSVLALKESKMTLRIRRQGRRRRNRFVVVMLRSTSL